MKKILLFLLLCILLTGCRDKGFEYVENLEGIYIFDECVYLNGLSSATKEYFTEQHSGIVYISFDGQSVEYQNTDQTTFSYDKVKYHSVSVTDNFDDIINFGMDDIFSQFDYRYDIYSDNLFTGISIFVNAEKIYLAEIRILGEHSDDFFIWTIFTLSKQE